MKFDWKFVAWTGGFLVFAVGAQSLRLAHLATSILVNMALYLVTALTNVVGGGVVACVAGWSAGQLGALRPELALVVPYLIAGNVVLVLVYGFLRGRSESLGIVLGAAARFLVISAAAMYVLKFDPRLRLSLGSPEFLAGALAGLLAVLLRQAGRAVVCRTGARS